MKFLTKSMIILSIATLLTACGGDNNKNHYKQAVTSQILPTEYKEGQSFTLGELGVLSRNDFNNKTYYARFAVCRDDNCHIIQSGVMHFKVTSQAGGKLSIDKLYIDNAGISSQSENDDIIYKHTGADTINLINSGLTIIDPEKRIYQLHLTSASPFANWGIEVPVVIDEYGNKMVSASDDYLLAVQHLDQAPYRWVNGNSNSQLAGHWYVIGVNEHNGMVQSISSITADLGNSQLKYGVSKFNMLQGKQTYYGGYKSSGYGYAFGYTKDNKPLDKDFKNYDGIQGVMITSPDNSFGVGYDANSDGGVFFLTR